MVVLMLNKDDKHGPLPLVVYSVVLLGVKRVQQHVCQIKSYTYRIQSCSVAESFLCRAGSGARCITPDKPHAIVSEDP